MSANKYANLPDIDTAPDVYETEDVFPSSHDNNADSSDDEPTTARTGTRTRTVADGTTGGTTAGPNREELDMSPLISAEQAAQRFRKAERERRHQRTRFAYPSSSESESDDESEEGEGSENEGENENEEGEGNDTAHLPARKSQEEVKKRKKKKKKKKKSITLPVRLRALQAELAALEAELGDPSNPALRSGDREQKQEQEREQDDADATQDRDEGEEEHANEGGEEKTNGGVDPGEMIMGLVDVRKRLEKVRKAREGRGRLVGIVVGEEGNPRHHDREELDEDEDDDEAGVTRGSRDAQAEMKSIVEMDKRVGELEKLVGSVGATLDETTPLTPPLLPMLMRLNNQLTLLTQPRHIDSVSRRLKLLLSDLERVSASQAQKRQQAGGAVVLTPAQDAVLPLLFRLAPSLPHIPHILTRLRTLSALHASASEFQSTMASLEEEQRRTREALEALSGAVTNVEASLEANRRTVASNVNSLEDRVEKVLGRLDEVAN